jgi:sterol desaturase/sphingolipid hydroxylase (fatty acid hydroxylase superfamily)
MIVLQPLPGIDIQNGIFRAWWFDPLVATVSFAVLINWYWYHERRLGLSTVQELRWEVLNASSQPVKATVGYWVGIYVWRIIVPPAGNNQLPDGIPFCMLDLAYLGAEVIAGIVFYDAIFFWIHWGMHRIPFFRHVHHDHHDISKGTLESRDVLRHSFLDASLQVLVNIFVQRYTPWGAVKSRVARAFHNILVIWFLTESHTAAPVPNIWRRWLVGVREHRLHHLGGSPDYRYQQFFGYLDDFRLFYAKYQLRVRHSPATRSKSELAKKLS